MRPARLQALARDWIAPTLTGLAVAALVVAGTEAGGWVARATLALSGVALAAFVAWGARVLARVQEDLAAWPGDAEGD